MSLQFDEYQTQAITTNLRKDDSFKELMQQVLGLGDEAGEVLALLDKKNITKELGDILWYIAVVAHDLDISLDDIASMNLEKLKSRQQRGTLRGSGDNR